MIQEIIKQWDERKIDLEKSFQVSHPSSYEDIVTKLFTVVIIEGYKVENLVTIDHGDYQGTQLFFIPKDTYQPNASEYIWTDNYYGSCSGCDTLEAIRNYEDDPPTEEQVKEYMMLALHLIQGFKPLSQ